MNKLFALLLVALFMTSCEIYAYETPMRPAVIPHYSIDTYYGPECYNADYQYIVGHGTLVCEWQCASYPGYNRTSLEIYFERYYNGWEVHGWEVHESLGPHYCYY